MARLLLLLIIAVAATLAARNSKGLQVHIFDVGQAASELLVFPSGYSVLVDCGETSWQSNENAKYVGQQVEKILGTKKVDVAVLSHLHLDHVGYAGKGGFWHLIEKQGFTFGKVVDRDSGIWDDKNGDGECDKDNEIAWHNIGTLSGTFSSWLCYATNPSNTKIYAKRQLAELCSTNVVAPPDDGASVTIVTVDGHGVKQTDGTAVSGDHSDMDVPPNENDFSIGLLVKFGDFTYSTAGDLDGEYHAESTYQYNDEESVVQKRIGEVDVYHVNHHGSAHSSNQKWLNALAPTASIASLGYNNSYSHPDQNTLNRLLKAGDVFLTEEGCPTRKYGDTIIANGDVVIETSADGAKFTISTPKKTVSYKSKAVKTPKCTTEKVELRAQA